MPFGGEELDPYSPLPPKAQTMDPRVTPITVHLLTPGDAIVGDDDREYLIDRIAPSEFISDGSLEVHAYSEDGKLHHTILERGAHVNAILRLAVIKPDSFGARFCDNCSQYRMPRLWAADDYVCNECRKAIDSPCE